MRSSLDLFSGDRSIALAPTVAGSAFRALCSGCLFARGFFAGQSDPWATLSSIACPVTFPCRRVAHYTEGMEITLSTKGSGDA